MSKRAQTIFSSHPNTHTHRHTVTASGWMDDDDGERWTEKALQKSVQRIDRDNTSRYDGSRTTNVSKRRFAASAKTKKIYTAKNQELEIPWHSPLFAFHTENSVFVWIWCMCMCVRVGKCVTCVGDRRIVYTKLGTFLYSLLGAAELCIKGSTCIHTKRKTSSDEHFEVTDCIYTWTLAQTVNSHT